MADAITLDEVLADASPPERLVPLCVAGRLVAEHQALTTELEQARESDRAAPAALGTVPKAPEVAARIRELEQRMRAATHTFRFRALPPKGWSDLLAAHPDTAGKRMFGDSFPLAAIAACCVEPAGLSDPAKFDRLLAALSAAQVSDLFDGAWEVNTTAPKELTSYVASMVLQGSEPS